MTATQTTVRLPKSTMAELVRVTSLLNDSDAAELVLAGRSVTRGATLRYAIAEGVKVLAKRKRWPSDEGATVDDMPESVRLPDTTHRELAQILEGRDEPMGVVLRLAVVEGLKVLGRRYGS